MYRAVPSGWGIKELILIELMRRRFQEEAGLKFQF
jgi:hypothetical protein